MLLKIVIKIGHEQVLLSVSSVSEIYIVKASIFKNPSLSNDIASWSEIQPCITIENH